MTVLSSLMARRRAGLMLLATTGAVMGAGLLAGCQTPSAGYRATRTAQVAHVAGMPVNVTTDNGFVEILKSGGPDVEITAHIRARSQDRLEATRVSVVREASGALSVGVDWPDAHRKSNEGCAFEIKVPDASGVRVETSNGHIRIVGLSGRADLDTSNGRIVVASHQGEAKVHTSNGRIEVERVDGDVSARTSNGAIELAEVGGAVDAGTSNGAINVRLAPSSTGPVFADSSNGGVYVEVGPAFSGVARLRTSNGRIAVDGAEATGGKSDKTVRIGAGGDESIISTSNGRIQLVVKGS